MSALFNPPKPEKPPRAPQIDDAIALRNERDRALRRGAGARLLSSEGSGLPDLGSTYSPRASGG